MKILIFLFLLCQNSFAINPIDFFKAPANLKEVKSENSSLTSFEDKNLRLRVIVGKKPYYHSIIPSVKDLYISFGDKFIQYARNLDYQKSGIDSANLYVKEPDLNEVEGLQVASGILYFLDSDINPCVFGLTMLYKAVPIYISKICQPNKEEPNLESVLELIDFSKLKE